MKGLISSPLRSIRSRFAAHLARPHCRSAVPPRYRARVLRAEPLENRCLLADWTFGIGAGQEITPLDQCLDSSGNLYICGNFAGTVDFDPSPDSEALLSSAGSLDGFVAKYDQSGHLVWAKQVVKGPGYDFAQSVTLDQSGNLYVAGQFRDTAFVGDGTTPFTSWTDLGDGYLVKYTESGALASSQWVEIWPGCDEYHGGLVAPQEMVADGSGDLYVTGYFDGNARFGTFTLPETDWGRNDAFLVKFDTSSREVRWAWRTWGSCEGRELVLGDVRSDGFDAYQDIYVAGVFGDYFVRSVTFDSAALTPNGNADVYVAKLTSRNDSTPTVQWAQRMGCAWTEKSNVTGDMVHDIARGLDGALYLTGYFRDEGDFGAHNLTSYGGYDYFVAQLDQDGNIVRAGNIGAAVDDNVACNIAVAPTGEVFIAGPAKNPSDVDPGPGAALIASASRQDTFLVQLDKNLNFEHAWTIPSTSGANSPRGLLIRTDAQGVATGVEIVGRFGGTVDFPDPCFDNDNTDPGTLTSSGAAADIYVTSFTPVVTPQAAPDATDDFYANGWQYYTLEVPVWLGVLANDTDGNHDSLTAVCVTNGTYGDVTLNPDGSFTYVPYRNSGYTYPLEDTFTYSVSDGKGGTATATATIAVSALPSHKEYSSADAAVPLLDYPNTTLSRLVIDDPFEIADLNVKLSISHPRLNDLDVFLVAPDGTRVELFTDVGKGPDFQDTVLDDEAQTSITRGTSPFSGSYRPEGSLSSFDGKIATGTWTLEITDDTRKQTGTLLSWSLDLSPAVPVAPTSTATATDLALAESEFAPLAKAAVWLASTQARRAHAGAVDAVWADSTEEMLIHGAL